jgi:hypothetical protein
VDEDERLLVQKQLNVGKAAVSVPLPILFSSIRRKEDGDNAKYQYGMQMIRIRRQNQKGMEESVEKTVGMEVPDVTYAKNLKFYV